MVKQKTDGQFMKFTELLRQIHVSLPFIEIIQQMPKYAKFLKNLLSNKNNLELATQGGAQESVALSWHYVPINMTNLGIFSLPYSIGHLQVIYAQAGVGPV
jgi:glutaredoxin-related protein